MPKPLRILLADDSRFFRTIEAKFLQKTPAEVLEAADCETTLVIMREVQPDLVYMAYTLQPDGGSSCCELIKRDPNLRHIPVVMVCDQENSEGQIAQARLKGCDDVLVKPLDRFQFLQVGRKFLSGIREHRQPSFFTLQISFDGKTTTGKCLDMSGGGMFVESQEDIPVGKVLDLSFKLPDKTSTQVTCQAEVMWLNRRPNPMKPHYPHGLGLKFVGLSNDSHAAIIRLSVAR